MSSLFSIPLASFQVRRLLLCFSAVAFTAGVFAQTKSAPKKPYAALDRNAVSYAGPGRATRDDLPGKSITIGIIVPMRGPEAAEGKAMLTAAQLALDEAMAEHAALHLRLAVGDETGPWGRVSNEIVRLLFREDAVVIITSADGNIAHQAEQIANKIGVPVLTLSGDPTTTEINLPWIFRLLPSDTDQARILAERIYKMEHLQRVVLAYESDHDGRIGRDEFRKAVELLRAPAPSELEISLPSESQLKTPDIGESKPAKLGDANSQLNDPQLNDLQSLALQIEAHKPQAVVLWMSAPIATKLTLFLQKTDSNLPLYLCRKAVEGLPLSLTDSSASDILAVFPPVMANQSNRRAFADQYRVRTGYAPTFAAAETYDAVRLVATALLQSGPNRARLRDALSRSSFVGLASTFSFDPAGNLQGKFLITKW
jgi:ABC-type branched-subunit amino acid transport system substrate-binding protein